MREIAFQPVSQLMRTSPLMFSATDTVSRFVGSLHQLGPCEALVVFKKRMGVVTALDILDTMHPERTLLGNVARRASSLSREATVLEAVDLMVSNRLRAIPIMEKGKVIGVISCMDILDAMMKTSALEDVLCRDAMKPSRLSVKGYEKVSTARSIMCRHDIGQLPVVDDHGRIEGTITAEDIVLVFTQPEKGMTRGEFVGESVRVWDILVKELMDENPLIVKEDDTLANAAKGLRELRKQVCVVERRRGLGIITPMEIIALLLEFKVEEMVHVRILGSPAHGEFLDLKTIQDKIARVLNSGFTFYKGTKEVIIDVKRRKRDGKRNFYEIIARIYSSSKPLVVTAHGWYLAEAFNKLHNKLDRVMRRGKKRRPRAESRYTSEQTERLHERIVGAGSEEDY